MFTILKALGATLVFASLFFGGFLALGAWGLLFAFVITLFGLACYAFVASGSYLRDAGANDPISTRK